MTDGVWGAVLVGGRSSRMGEDKALLPLGDRTMLDRILAVMDRIFPRVALVVGEQSRPVPAGREILHDAVHGRGPIAGVAAALSWCEAEHVFVTACDMPFPDARLIQLIAGAPDAPMVAPEAGGRMHPLHARYARGMLGPVEAAIAADRRRMTDLFPDGGLRITEHDLARHGIDPGRALMNVNTPGELERARRWLLSGDMG